mmetsp:Transcript_39776/g.51296  ORF Transcript_39776/g.51296 Transcript_39776/m.51296 type:complete len:211 (-) Transcript_39776:51-683(-)
MENLFPVREEVEYEEDYFDEEEYEKAMRLNAQLRMLEVQMAQEEKMGGGLPAHPQQAAAPRRTGGPAGKHPTFSGPGQLRKKTQKDNYTFTKQEMTAMQKENFVLLKNLAQTEDRRGKDRVLSNAPTALQHRKEASSTINRRRKDDRVAKENAAMARRLQSTKSTIPGATKKTGKPKNRTTAQPSRQVVRKNSDGTAQHKQEWNGRFSYT